MDAMSVDRIAFTLHEILEMYGSMFIVDRIEGGYIYMTDGTVFEIEE